MLLPFQTLGMLNTTIAILCTLELYNYNERICSIVFGLEHYLFHFYDFCYSDLKYMVLRRIDFSYLIKNSQTIKKLSDWKYKNILVLKNNTTLDKVHDCLALRWILMYSIVYYW